MKFSAIITAILLGFFAAAQSSDPGGIDLLVRRLDTVTNDSAKARLLNNITRAYINLDAGKTMFYARKGMEQAKKMGWQKAIAIFHRNLGEGYAFQNLPAAIFSEYDSALIILEKIKDTGGLSDLMNDYGRQYQNLGKMPQATGYYFKALKLAEQIDDSRKIILYCNNISAIFRDQQNFDKAFEYASRALTIAKKNNLPEESATSLNEIANIYLTRGDSAKANTFYRQALEAYQKNEDDIGIASVYTNLSILCNSDYRKKIDYGLRAKDIWDRVSPNYETAIINLGNIGVAYLDIARYDTLHQVKAGGIIPGSRLAQLDRAVFYLQETLYRNKQSGNVGNAAYYTGILAETQAEKGDFKNAYLNFRIFQAAQDSIYSQETKNKIASLETQREVDLRDKQIQLNQLSLATQRKQRAALLAGICLLAIIGGLLYWQNHDRKKANRKLSSLNKELDEANKIKATFFSILSHDLRSPVANLISFLHLQQEAPDLLTAQSKEQHTKKIRLSAENLLENMEELLLWSKGQMTHFKPDKKELPVKKLFDDIKTNFVVFDKAKIIFTDSQQLIVNTDEDYLKTIMRNLTSNAIKALDSIADPVIEWRAWAENGKPYISITDNGNGISEQQLATLSRSDSSIGIKSGLGFHLVKDMAKAIGATISFQSQPGVGTTFTVAL